ncbi:hypothetical protein KP509_34G051500 [Ceratopteris richardii]|uniref:Uncharacterized protein n=1 Tax=Ceratopteris richardii TaxID=49495 RepID=A0A8T2QL94_CERRI|nr:hypothetical protein KP509_34G051500 [Ceratopteris richardii]
MITVTTPVLMRTFIFKPMRQQGKDRHEAITSNNNLITNQWIALKVIFFTFENLCKTTDHLIRSSQVQSYGKLCSTLSIPPKGTKCKANYFGWSFADYKKLISCNSNLK